MRLDHLQNVFLLTFRGKANTHSAVYTFKFIKVHNNFLGLTRQVNESTLSLNAISQTSYPTSPQVLLVLPLQQFDGQYTIPPHHKKTQILECMHILKECSYPYDLYYLASEIF